jgi:hypothetical protein
MALGYPLSLGQFFEDTEISTQRFTLSDSRQFNTTGAGHILDASLGSRLWTGEVTLRPMLHQDMLKIESRIELLLEPGASFLVYDKRCTWPYADPTGSILGAATPTLGAVNVNNVDVTIAGLPVGYVLTQGDMFSFSYSSSPLRRALHRIVSGATADGSGNATVQVVPPIRPGYALAASIALNKPLMKAKIVPGSYQFSTGTAGRLSTGATFQMTQTLR